MKKIRFNDRVLITSGFYKGLSGLVIDYDFLLGYSIHTEESYFTVYCRTWQLKKYYSTEQDEAYKHGYAQGMADAKSSIKTK